MKHIKFRRPHFKFKNDTFSHFTYWGVNLPVGNFDSHSEFTSPGSNSSCYTKEDEMSTGLFDKNGIEIFEGDIILHYDKDKTIIKYDVDSAGFNICYYMCECIMSTNDIEVIGNIHQNPEMLGDFFNINSIYFFDGRKKIGNCYEHPHLLKGKESNQPYKYEVDLTRTIEVTAKDADEAIDKAFDTLRADIPLLSINQDEFSYRANRK